MHVSSSPPLRTGLATLTAPGSAPLSTLHGMTMKRRCPLLQFHAAPPVDSLRVHWGPWLPSSHRLGAFALRPPPGVHGWPVRRLLCPRRRSPEAASCREALPPPSFPTALGLPRGASRVPPGRLPPNAGGGVCIAWPRPLFVAPQSWDRGEGRWTSVTVALPGGDCLGPSSQRSCRLAGATGGPGRQGRSGPALNRRA